MYGCMWRGQKPWEVVLCCAVLSVGGCVTNYAKANCRSVHLTHVRLLLYVAAAVWCAAAAAGLGRSCCEGHWRADGSIWSVVRPAGTPTLWTGSTDKSCNMTAGCVAAVISQHHSNDVFVAQSSSSHILNSRGRSQGKGRRGRSFMGRAAWGLTA